MKLGNKLLLWCEWRVHQLEYGIDGKIGLCDEKNDCEGVFYFEEKNGIGCGGQKPFLNIQAVVFLFVLFFYLLFLE